MAARTYHDSLARIGAAVLAWGLALTAPAGQLRLGGLGLTHDAAWQRGDPAEETAADSLILTRAPTAVGQADEEPGELTLYLPRHATPVREDARRFRDQLEQKWRLRYGDGARFETRTLDGRDWFTCRRPSRDGRDTVFQWVTLEAGLAYSLVWFSVGSRDTLPSAAEALMQGIAFSASGSWTEPQAPATPPAAGTASPLASTDRPPGGPDAGWRLDQVILARPSDSALEALAQMDATRLPPGSELTGYGLRVDAASLDWFLDGFRWEPVPPGPEEGGPRVRKASFRHGGWARWEGLPPSLGQAAMAPLALRFGPGPEEGEGEPLIGLRFQWLDLCLEEGLSPLAHAHMARGSHAALERLLRRRPKACPEPDAQALPEPVLVQAGPVGTERNRAIALPLPLPLPLAQTPVARGLTRALVLAARPFVSTTEDQPGDGLLRQAGVYYLYTPPP